MNYMDRQVNAGHGGPSVLVFFLAKVLDRMKRIEPMILIWWCLVLSVLSSSVARFTTESLGLTYYVLLIVGSGGCVWIWLLSRALFCNKRDSEQKAFIWVAVVIGVEASAALMSHVVTDGMANEMGRVLNNTASMVCIASIVFVWAEVLKGYSKIRSTVERRFRMIFLGMFNLVVAVSVLWVSGAGSSTFAAEWHSVLLTSCGITVLVGSRLAVNHRLKTMREKAPRFEHSRLTLTEVEVADMLAQSILTAIKNEAILTTPNLKVAEFAEQIGEQEYKVTRCITNRLQYRNFNHLLNSHRIDRAKRIFNDPDSRHLKIATVAYDCGFNSLGPFNRAFKQYTGITPREFKNK